MLQKFNPKHANLIIRVSGKLLKQEQGKVSVFQGPTHSDDAVWEEWLRLYKEVIFCLNQRLERLRASAPALVFAPIPANEEFEKQLSKR